MDHIERHTQHFGDADGTGRRFAFDLRWPRQRVTLGSGHTIGQQFLLHVIDEVAVLGVDLRQGAQRSTMGKPRDELFVVHHDGAFVGHEKLVAVDASVPGEDFHLLGDLIAPPCNGNVKAVVGGGLLGPPTPRFEGFDQRRVGTGYDEVDDHRGAAGGGGGGSGIEIVANNGAHERHLHVSMGIDAAGHHVLSCGINNLRPGRNVEPLANRGDAVVHAVHIGPNRPIRRNHGATLDENRHVHLSLSRFDLSILPGSLSVAEHLPPPRISCLTRRACFS